MSGERFLPAECGRLAAGLRELKDRTGLSLAALGGRTPYSKSSWERYLNGKKLPPRQAVEALCRLADEPADRLLALWELAEQSWSGRAAAGEAPTQAPPPVVGEQPEERPEEQPEREPERKASFARRVLLLTGVAVLAVAGLVLSLILTSGGSGAGGRDPDPLAASSYPQSYEPGCRGAECEGADPTEMGCGAQGMLVTLLQRRAAGGQRVEIRYSEKCAAVWVRSMRLRLGDRVVLSLPGSDPKELKAASQRDTEVYLSTAMTATKYPDKARVCVLPAGGSPECFVPQSPAPRA
ncbi:helix-turn-helix domain-containing protein [Streptomyces sp. NPDC037389]|uniref:helix-turn-helix domain-containing protein n=1 Tax=Streptomyces sp. NPDC037389 TaxID=3155369 RepID=UPI0033F8BC48